MLINGVPYHTTFIRTPHLIVCKNLSPSPLADQFSSAAFETKLLQNSLAVRLFLHRRLNLINIQLTGARRQMQGVHVNPPPHLSFP